MARAHARRPDEPLGTHLAPLRTRRLPAQDLDGLGDDWPIGYDDLKPYYDEIDRLIGVFGSNEGLPNDPDGMFLPPPRPRCYRAAHQAGMRQHGRAVHAVAIVDSDACHSTGAQPATTAAQCTRGCKTNSNFSSPGVLIEPAIRTGRLTLLTNAMAREVTTDESAAPPACRTSTRPSGTDEHVLARIVVLAASACESARLLLNSKHLAFPNGLANTSGMAGRYLTDTTGTDVAGFVPRLADHVPHNEDGVGGMHIYMPWWVDNRTLDFPRGYHIEPWGGMDHRPTASWRGSNDSARRRIRHRAQERLPALTTAPSSGSPAGARWSPTPDSYCEIDPDVVDRWGIPVLRFHWKWSDHEYKQAKHMQETCRALISADGRRGVHADAHAEEGYGLAAGGRIIHELGGDAHGR